VLIWPKLDVQLARGKTRVLRATVRAENSFV